MGKHSVVRMQLCYRAYLFILFILPHSDLLSQSLPTTHWAYDSIRKIQILGGFQELPQGSLPYSRDEIARGLIQLKLEQNAQIIKLHPEYDRLIHEFDDELKNYSDLILQSPKEIVDSDLSILSKISVTHQPQFTFQSRVTYNIYPHLSLQYGGILDQSLISDPSYWGYEWQGIAGYQDQMFILFKSQNLNAMLGRDYVVWGYGHSGGLFITDNSRSFDMLKLTIIGKLIRIESFVAQLDQLYDADRYLTATRIAISSRPQLILGFGQAALYGGINRPLDFTLSNPLSFYSFSQDNDQKYLNMMLYADFAFTVKRGYRLYGELLIDDFQIDREEQSDLEPNEIAFMFGGEGVQLLNRLDAWVEYTQVRNRTYNVQNMRPWEKFIHRGRPIAHPYGTDFRLLAAQCDVWIYHWLQSYMAASVLKKGEGTIKGDFTTPWMANDVSLESGYSEKIPTGIIESTSSVKVGLICIASKAANLDISIGYQEINNEFNISERNSSGINASVKLVVEYNKSKRYKLGAYK